MKLIFIKNKKCQQYMSKIITTKTIQANYYQHPIKTVKKKKNLKILEVIMIKL